MFLRGQSRGFWVEVLLGSDCEHSPVGGEAVIEVGCAEDVDTRKSPCDLGLAVRCTLSS